MPNSPQSGDAMASAEFWYEFASTYSYPAALRVAALAESAASRRVAAVPARADIRRAGLARFAVQHLSRQGPLHVARPRAHMRGDGPPTQAAGPVSAAQPARRAGRVGARGRSSAQTSRAESTSPNSAKGGRSPTDTLAALLAASAPTPRRRSRRRKRGEQGPAEGGMRARAEIGIFGAPCLVTEDGEVFWGNDRLEQGLDWAARRRARVSP